MRAQDLDVLFVKKEQSYAMKNRRGERNDNSRSEQKI